MKFDKLVTRFVAAQQFDPATGAIEPFGQQSNQGIVGGGVHGWRGYPDSQFGAGPAMRHDFIGGRTGLQFHRQQGAVRLRTKKIGKRHGRWQPEIYLSSGLINRNVTAASAPPVKLATR